MAKVFRYVGQESQTERTKTICPQIPFQGHKKLNTWIQHRLVYVSAEACVSFNTIFKSDTLNRENLI